MPERRQPPRKTFSRERCLRDCKRMRDAHRCAHCCADCLALQLAARTARANSTRPRKAPTTATSPRSRRMQLLFGAPARKAPAKRGGLSGVAPLGDAAADRRAGLATSSGIAAAALITCQNAYPGDARREDRERCIAAVTALRSAADNIINAATTSDSSAAADSSSADIEAALEEMRTNLEEIEAQARAEEQAKAEQRQRDERRAREQQQNSQNQMWMIGGVALLAIAAGYLVLRDDDEAA